jgi:nucleotide-binding universal stress UspA family protein
MIKRILVGLGGTRFTNSAIQRATELATAHDAELTAVSVVDIHRLSRVGPVPLGASTYAAELRNHRLNVAREHVEQSLQQFSDACAKLSVRHRTLREEGEPFSLMIDEARYHDLMIFGLRSLFEFDLVSDPHDALVRLVSSGVRPIIAVAPEHRPIERVLIAYSGSMESAKTMKQFVQTRLWPNAKVRIVTFEHSPDKAEALVADAADYCRTHGIEPEAAYVPQSPKSHLLSEAETWGADLIVVGNSAKNLLLRRIFGETALHVIRESDRPLYLSQ